MNANKDIKKFIEKPKVFISYAHTNDSYRDEVRSFVNKLIENGIDAISDLYDLPLGADLYHCMEEFITDPSIDKVLILINDEYTKKANDREGGAGAETQIISERVYNKSEPTKFIPVIFQRNPDGNFKLPTYLSSIIYIDYSCSDRETNFDKLVQTIYGIDKHIKPEIGSPPECVTGIKPDRMSILSRTVNKISRFIDEGKIPLPNHHEEFANLFNEALREYTIDTHCHGEERKEIIWERLNDSIKISNIFLKYLNLIKFYPESGILLSNLFEGAQNYSSQNSESIEDLPVCLYIIYETFLYSASIFYRHKLFKNLDDLINRTYSFSLKQNKLKHSQNGTYVDFQNCFMYGLGEVIDEFKDEIKSNNFLYRSVSDRFHGLQNSKIIDFLLNRLEDQQFVIPLLETNLLLSGHSDMLEVQSIYQKNWIPFYINKTHLKNIFNNLQSKRYADGIRIIFQSNSIEELITLFNTNKIEFEKWYSTTHRDCNNIFDFDNYLIGTKM